MKPLLKYLLLKILKFLSLVVFQLFFVFLMFFWLDKANQFIIPYLKTSMDCLGGDYNEVLMTCPLINSFESFLFCIFLAPIIYFVVAPILWYIIYWFITTPQGKSLLGATIVSYYMYSLYEWGIIERFKILSEKFFLPALLNCQSNIVQESISHETFVPHEICDLIVEYDPRS